MIGCSLYPFKSSSRRGALILKACVVLSPNLVPHSRKKIMAKALAVTSEGVNAATS
jgi:hypothetical protein